MPKRCSSALKSAFTSWSCASRSGRLNQLTLYTSMSSRARKSRATMSITLTCPPWELNSTSLRIPAAATDSPMSVHSRRMVSALSVSVPGKRACSGLRPTACVGSTNTFNTGARCASAAASTPSTSTVSTLNGKCGPCCSVAATGNTAMVCAASPLWIRLAKSRVERSAQNRDLVVMGQS